MLIGVILSRALPQIRRSARAFARAPRLSFALLISIALGVGSNAAVYGFLEGLIHPASPLRVSDKVVSIFRQDRSREAGPLSPDEYQLLSSAQGLFDWIGAVRIKPGDIIFGGHAEIATVATVTPSLAGALAIPLDDGVVLSHRIWKSEFGNIGDAAGSNVHIDNGDYRIAGVAPENLDGLYSDQSIDLWTRSRGADLASGGRDRRDLWVLAHLRSHVSFQQAQAALRSGPAGLHDVNVTPFTGIAPNMARGLARVRLFLTFSAGAVFFIACINVASFLLGRALRRSHETSLRVALGASRAVLLRELLADSVVLSVAGGALGLLLGMVTARVLPAFLFEEDAERLQFAPHLLPILMASLACIAITVLCGMLPVVGTVTDRPWMVLQRETGSPSKTIGRLRSGLVVAQITACCMLVMGTALLVEGLHAAFETSAGHRLGDPILLTVEAPRPDGPEIDTHYFSEVEKAANTVAGLSPLGWMANLPGNQATWQTFRLQRPTSQDREVGMDIAWLTPDSFDVLDRLPAAGRMFGFYDQGHGMAVVNEEAATELFGRQTVGEVIHDPSGRPIEVIGIVKRRSGEAKLKARPTIYYGFREVADAPATIKDAEFRVPVAPAEGGAELNANSVSANYFAALDVALIAGQKFPEHSVAGMGHVAVINQEAADLYFKGKPLGTGVIDESGARTEVIGVVKSQVFGTFEQHAEPTIYFLMWQSCPARMTLMLKYAKWGQGMVADLRKKIENVPGRGPGTVRINTFEKQLAQSGLAGLRIAAMLGGASAVTGLLLSILGLLSSQGDAERQRQRERALRIALGAQRWRIVLLVVKNAGGLAFVGSVAGTFLSYTLSRLMIAGIAVVTSPPLLVWLIAPLLPAAAIIIASMLPARRASVISPAAIMREN